MTEPKAKRSRTECNDWDDLQLTQAFLEDLDRIPTSTNAGGPSMNVKALPVENLRKDAVFSAAGIDDTEMPGTANLTNSCFLHQTWSEQLRPAVDYKRELEELKKTLRSVSGERNILRNRIKDFECEKSTLERRLTQLQLAKREQEEAAKRALEENETRHRDAMHFKEMETTAERDRWKRERAERSMLDDSQMSNGSQSQNWTTPTGGARMRKVVVAPSTSKTVAFGPDHVSFFGRSRPARTPLSVSIQKLPSHVAVEADVDQNRRPPAAPKVETWSQTDTPPAEPQQLHQTAPRRCVITELLVERQVMKLMDISLTDESASVPDEEELQRVKCVVEHVLGGQTLSDVLKDKNNDKTN